MFTTSVTLVNDKTIDVRRLGMFEIDDIPKDIPGPYTVSILFDSGEVYEQPLDLTTPRRKPDKPFEDCEEKSSDWHDWREYYSWQEGLLHAQKQWEAYCDYCERVAVYIRQNCILTEIDHDEIMVDDWPRIYRAALCPMVTMEDIAAAMRQNF